MNAQTAVEIMNAKGWVVSSLSYRAADAAASKNRCTYLYDAGNGDVGKASYNTATGKVHHSLTRDAKIWIF